MYDPATDIWTTKASMLTPIANMEANVVDDKIYVKADYSTSPNRLYQVRIGSMTLPAILGAQQHPYPHQYSITPQQLSTTRSS